MLSPKLYTFLCGSFASFGSALFGYDLGVISSILPAPNFLETMKLDPNSDSDTNYTGFIVSALLLGAFISSVPAGLIADKFSRRVAITVGAIVFIIGGALQTAAQNKEMMLAGRFVAGMGIGALATLAPLYQSEIAHPSLRGRLTSLQQFFLGIGSLVAGWIGYGCTERQYGTVLQWRLPLGIQMLPAVPLLFITLVLPESPRWLMMKGRDEEARIVLAQLHSRGDINDSFVVGEFEDMRAKLHEERAVAQGWSAIIHNTSALRKIFLGIILQFSVQTTGVSAIQYYSPTVYQAVGYSVSTTLLIQSLNNINALFGEAACVLFVDKLGRRKPLITGNIVAGITFCVAAALARVFANGGGSSGQAIAFVAMTFIFNFAFSSCIGPISWVYPVEIMGTAIRARGTGITTSASWIANFMIGQVSPIAFKRITWRYYIVFAVFGFTNAITMWLLFPETKGRTLEEMDEYFEEVGWVVPLAKKENIGKHQRERELAQGRLTAHHEPKDLEAGGEKGEVAHYN